MLSTVKKVIPVAVAVLASSALLAGCGGDDQVNSDAVATVKVLYRSGSQNSTNVFGSLRQQLASAQVNVIGVPATDQEYAQILGDGTAAEHGSWDIAVAGRAASGGADAGSIITPLFDGRDAFPPYGSNVGRYTNPAVSALIDQAGALPDQEASALWNQIDRAVLDDAAVFPIAEPQQANYASKLIGHREYVPAFQNYDPTTVTKKHSGPGAPSATETTLHLLGSGDVDTMDPNLSYYSIGYLSLRMWSRQLYAFPTAHGQAEPDLASGPPVLTQVARPGQDTFTRVTIPIRAGVLWNTKPAREATAADVVRGVKRSCNPVKPFPGLDRYVDLIDGLRAFCKKFDSLGSQTSPAAIAAMLDENVPGIVADGNSVVLTLTRPNLSVAAVTSLLTLSPFRAAPVEYLADLPGSLTPANMISNGPYRVASYRPASQIVFTRNHAWNQATDPVRAQHFTRVEVDETVSQSRTQVQLQAGSPKADMEWDNFVPVSAVPALAGDANMTIRPTMALDPYLVFNTVSPNNSRALGRVEVRQALSSAISRTALVEALGGTPLFKPLTHVLPDSIAGTARFELYAYEPEQARAKLAELLDR